MTTKVEIFIYTIIFAVFLVWQSYELYHYGDDARVNIFSTGDYKHLLGETHDGK